MSNKRVSKARQKFLPIEEPAVTLTHTNEERNEWLQEITSNFVQPSKANRAYYKVVIETLWPVGHGIPGPHTTEDEIRNAVNSFRIANNYGKDPSRPYVDVFRRVRELQGEEGVTGIARAGRSYQLVSLKTSEKRIPRTKLSDENWKKVKEAYHNCCAVCRKREPEIRLQQDHKVPRTRNGSDDIENWQPLCDECNNFKSVSCRGCTLECDYCCWAYPERNKPLILSPQLAEKVTNYCLEREIDPIDLITEAVLGKIGSENGFQKLH
jgi:5-methylcytosine-specific restriction endonuclease McrA